MRLLGEYLRSRFGCKVYKVALNGGFTCPNRDGTLGTRGCIFCSAGGSGEFAESSDLSITEQIERGKEPVSKLRALFTEAIMHPDVVAISIATRPDCLPPETLDLLAELNEIKPVWVELGLQTIHEETARYIRRGYDLPVYDRAVKNLRERDIEVITHVILGLPGESEDDMVETVKYVCASGANGIKLQLLHILRGTDLEQEYNAGRVKILTEDEYIRILRKCVVVIPENVVIHRLTGDGDKRLLVAPLWSGDKKRVWNRIQREVLS